MWRSVRRPIGNHSLGKLPQELSSQSELRVADTSRCESRCQFNFPRLRSWTKQKLLRWLYYGKVWNGNVSIWLFKLTKNIYVLLKIYDGNTREAPVLGTHCQSSDQVISYISSGHQMLVVMRTDALVSAKGFKAEYNRTCGARIEVDESGSIRSSSTLHTMSSTNCSWILYAKDPGMDFINFPVSE